MGSSLLLLGGWDNASSSAASVIIFRFIPPPTLFCSSSLVDFSALPELFFLMDSFLFGFTFYEREIESTW